MAKLSPVALRGDSTAMRMQARSDRDWTGARRIMTKLPRTPELDAAMTTFFQASALLDQIRLRIWDRENLTLSANPDPSIAPKNDDIERYWLKYYASTFNPARAR